MSNCVETSEDLTHSLKSPLILSACLSLSLTWSDDAFLPIFQVCFSPIVSCISVRLFNSITLKCRLIESALVVHGAVSDLPCLMMCFYYQLYFSPLLVNSISPYLHTFKCPHNVSALVARLCLMMSTTTALRKGLCLLYDSCLCHCDRLKYLTPDFWGEAST